MTRRPVMRPVLRLFAVLIVFGASLLAPMATGSPAQQAQAADTRQFNPGNIISDAVFFDGRAMDAQSVQDFLRSKSPSSCAAAATDGSPCLEDFRLTTATIAPDGLCNGYQGAAKESAATIIAKVAVSCRINPRVILVLLQKEMGFITSSNPTAKMYDRAAGYYCPDIGTGWCHPDYAGLQKQLYNAGKQYQRYATYPKNYSYRAGFSNTIQWSVPTSCGTSVVYIQNQATAGLYNYTPYRPNQAALDAGYGTGNSCSAYGNRNFWLYFTDWFGSTQFATGGAVVVRANAADTRALIGSSTGNVICGLQEGGCFQPFERGAIYWSPASGAHIVRGKIHERWADMKWETGRLGYPTGEEICGLEDGGCFQDFQRGAMYWTRSTGAQPVEGRIQEKWASTRWETGYLGYPTAAEKCGLADRACYQQFQGGRIYWSPATGAHVMVTGPVWSFWAAQVYERNPLGYPVGDQRCGLIGSGCFQEFHQGAVYWSPATGAQPVRGAIRNKWASAGWERGYLGYPRAAEKCGLTGGACYQQYQGGRIYWSPTTGARTMVPGPVWNLWAAQVYASDSLGYPVTDQRCGLADDGCSQTFQRGAVYSSQSHPARTVTGAVLTKYVATKAQAGALGYPVGNAVCGLADSGCFQDFDRGAIYASTRSGARLVLDGPIRTAWASQRWETGPLGYPTGDQVCGLRDGGCGQSFQGGAIYSVPGTGTRIVWGAIHRAWSRQNFEKGLLGYPTSAEDCSLPGSRCQQFFEGGAVVFSPSMGTHVVWGAIGRAWLADPSALGYPTGGEVCGLAAGGCSQTFEKGSLYWSPATGARMVSGAILRFWTDEGREAGVLGYPTQPPVVTSSAITQVFQGGTLVQDRNAGTVTHQ